MFAVGSGSGANWMDVAVAVLPRPRGGDGWAPGHGGQPAPPARADQDKGGEGAVEEQSVPA